VVRPLLGPIVYERSSAKNPRLWDACRGPAPAPVWWGYDYRVDGMPTPPRRAQVGVSPALADVERGLGALERLIAAQRETISLLAIQLAARTHEVRELHELLRGAQAAPASERPGVSPQALHEAAPAPPRRVHRRRPRWRRWLLQLLGD
jgi:hypothetical protein